MSIDLNDNFKSGLALAKVASNAYAEEAGGALAGAVERLAADLKWSAAGKGPFGALIERGARVLIKPNWVLHHNQSDGGMDPMITHPSVIKAVVHAVLQAEPAEVVVGDAPIQTCDFAKLLEVGDLATWADEVKKSDRRFKGVKDFRRTTSTYVNGVRVADENVLPEDGFVLFDLGAESLLEPITDEKDDFRVTCYDPRLMAQTHGRGRHRYLVASDVITMAS